jgi:hypothetical protein
MIVSIRSAVPSFTPGSGRSALSIPYAPRRFVLACVVLTQADQEEGEAPGVHSGSPTSLRWNTR